MPRELPLLPTAGLLLPTPACYSLDISGALNQIDCALHSVQPLHALATAYATRSASAAHCKPTPASYSWVAHHVSPCSLTGGACTAEHSCRVI